ncbi:hypothetical protein Trydic_g23952 [Trypoxylus dichotomus]
MLNRFPGNIAVPESHQSRKLAEIGPLYRAIIRVPEETHPPLFYSSFLGSYAGVESCGVGLIAPETICNASSMRPCIFCS